MSADAGSRARRLLREAVGVALCCAIFIGASALGRQVALPVPAGIVGALALAGLLVARILPLSVVMPGGDRLLRHLVIFFVPAAVLAVRQRALLWSTLVPMIVIVVVATTVGLVVAALIAQRLARAEGPGS